MKLSDIKKLVKKAKNNNPKSSNRVGSVFGIYLNNHNDNTQPEPSQDGGDSGGDSGGGE